MEPLNERLNNRLPIDSLRPSAGSLVCVTEVVEDSRGHGRRIEINLARTREDESDFLQEP